MVHHASKSVNQHVANGFKHTCIERGKKTGPTNEAPCPLRRPGVAFPACRPPETKVPNPTGRKPIAKRSDRSYTTPAKSTNDSKRQTKKDDRTPIQIKDLKTEQQRQSTSNQHKIPRKSKEKVCLYHCVCSDGSQRKRARSAYM